MKLALNGLALAGKTSLADYLVNNAHVYKLNYTDGLKQVVRHTLQSCGKDLTMEQMQEPEMKERLRKLYISMGEVLGYMREGFGVEQMLREMVSAQKYYDHFVFDNVRSEAQWALLKPHGFVLVGLDIDYDIQRARAEARGMTPAQLSEMRRDISELPMKADLYLDAERPVEENGNTLLRLAGLPVPEAKPKLTLVDKAG